MSPQLNENQNSSYKQMNSLKTQEETNQSYQYPQSNNNKKLEVTNICSKNKNITQNYENNISFFNQPSLIEQTKIRAKSKTNYTESQKEQDNLSELRFEEKQLSTSISKKLNDQSISRHIKSHTLISLSQSSKTQKN
ncbi:hypothetical protein PPERSA_01726 [Pseudocohnilembus persalinus]|uniref:Uncharacterized protein n=1 Tax=Pseudocohnilembus persalinus TaxID=266149 RepID=A0A0V0Q7V1_PSEPJ|nr:hypothetical protein PPERSA_01726 [Pseudocohnilembus persalinus]|eukprot:KRW98288.1 hypothetical protein PPERSA_01726 [Pseudocohnilembus persalinus]